LAPLLTWSADRGGILPETEPFVLVFKSKSETRPPRRFIPRGSPSLSARIETRALSLSLLSPSLLRLTCSPYSACSQPKTRESQDYTLDYDKKVEECLPLSLSLSLDPRACHARARVHSRSHPSRHGHEKRARARARSRTTTCRSCIVTCTRCGARTLACRPPVIAAEAGEARARETMKGREEKIGRCKMLLGDKRGKKKKMQESGSRTNQWIDSRGFLSASRIIAIFNMFA